MSYSAFVPCNCRTDGVTDPSPVPAAFNRDDGYWEATDVNLDIDLQINLDRWSENACPHELGEQWGEWIANIWGMSALRGAASALDLPTLRRILPSHNGGFVEVEDCRSLLSELDTLANSLLPLTSVAVVGTGKALLDQVLAPQWLFAGHQFCVVLMPDRLAITDGLTGARTLWSASRLSIETTRDGSAVVHNLDTGVTHDIGNVLDDWPRRTEVAIRTTRAIPEWSARKAQLLKRMCEASIMTGNRAYWT